ncbi:HD domain-containing protein [Aureivirga marina]|uniref:HD domain-containing protein n=1 Tax=Aureivirga marina TaxID=1182451 RepID=UPI0018C93AE7|nr:hypothetical protein [Aureivirga marina]
MENLWNKIAAKYSDNKELISEIWKKMESKYSERHRHYHNLKHIESMLQSAMFFKSEIKDFDAFLFSIFFHDIIYCVSRNDNEKKSAELAEEYLQQLNVPIKIIEKCKQQIKATKYHEIEGCSDTSYLIDLDLAVLGTSEEKYKEYAINIRKEYNRYPDFLYKRGRKKILKNFLEKQNIYKTKYFQENYESKAKENLKLEMESF